MKTIKYILATVLTVFATAGFTSCSDDDDYSIGQASEGAYFPDGLATSVRASNTSSVYELPVYRTSKDAPSTYTITSNLYPQTAGITIPSTVTFSGDATSTTLPISYDPDVVDQSQVYDITLTIENASNYGKSTQTLEFQVAAPLQTVVWDGSVPAGQSADGTSWPAVQGTCTGTCTYYYDVLDWGSDPELPIYKVYDESNPNSYQLIVQHWAYDTPFTITVEDDRVRDEYGNLIVSVDINDFGADITGGGYDNTKVVEFDYYYNYRGWGESGLYSSFDPETGLIEMPVFYYCSAGYIAYGYDYIQLDGYPDYSISVTYQGLYTNTSDMTYAIGTFTAGENVASIKAAIVETDDVSEALSYVLAGGDDVVDVTPGTDVRELFRVKKAGSYYIAAVSYDAAGNAQKYGYAEVNITFDIDETVDDPTEWNSLGSGQFVDGWVLPLFVSDPTEYVQSVEIRQHKDDPTLYSMVAPYGTEENVLYYYGYNECKKSRNIHFTVDGDYIEILPQNSGFISEYIMADTELVIENYEGFIADYNADYDLTAEEVHTILSRNSIPFTTIEDGIIEIPISPFTFDGYGQAAYSWTDSDGNSYVFESYIVLPGVDEEDAAQAVHHKIAKSIAHPKFKSLSQIKAMKAIRNQKLDNTAKATKVKKSNGKYVNNAKVKLPKSFRALVNKK